MALVLLKLSPQETLGGEGEICTLDGQVTLYGIQARPRAGALCDERSDPFRCPIRPLTSRPVDWALMPRLDASNCYKLLQNCYRRA